MRKFSLIATLWLVCLLTGCFPPPEPDTGRENEAERLVEQGTRYLRQAQLDDARAAFQVAYEVGGIASALDGLGCVAFLEADYRRAESYFLKALELDPSYRTPLANLGVLYDLLGKRKEALTLYESALRSRPSDARIRNNIAAALYDEARSSREEARALQELRKAAALAPHPVIVSNLESMRSR